MLCTQVAARASAADTAANAAANNEAHNDIGTITDYLAQPTSAETRDIVTRAGHYINIGRIGESRKLFEAYGRKTEFSEALYLAMSVMLIKRHAYQEATKYLADGIKKYPNSFSLRLADAENWISVDELDLAKPQLEFCRKLKPNSQAVSAEYANYYYALENYAEALKQSDLALSQGPGTIGIYVSRACILRNMKRDRESIVPLDKAMTLNPGHKQYDIRKLRGAQLMLIGRCDDAIKDFQYLAARDKTYEYPFVTRIGECYVQMKKYREALKYFDRAIMAKADYFAAHRGRLECLTQLGETRAAAEERKFMKETQQDFKPLK